MAEAGIGEVARRHGVPEMDPELALLAMHQAIDDGEAALAVVDIDWERYFTAYTATRATHLFDDLPDAQARVASTETDSVESTGLGSQLAGRPAAEQQRILLELIRTHMAAVLGYADGSGIDEQRAFRDVGFDSVTAVELRNRLNAATGLKLPATVIFDHPTPTELAELLRNGLDLGEERESAGSVLAELDRLEAALRTSGVARGERGKVTMRLQSLLSQWSAEESAEDQDQDEDGDVAGKLESATAGEVFDFIENELGMA